MSDQDDGGGIGPVGCGPQMTPRSSLGGSSAGSSSISTSSSSNSSKTAVSECLGAWLNYLNSLNNLCASGYRLSQTITNLDPTMPSINSAQCAWDDLARASAVATSTVKSHVVAVLQEFVTQPLNSNTLEQMEIEVSRREHNQGIIAEVAQTMINLQHQFCVASYDSFAHLLLQQVMEASDVYPPIISKLEGRTTSPHFQPHAGESQGAPRGASPHQEAAVRGPSPIQNFLENVRGPLPNPGHLLAMKTPFYRGSRSPLNFPLFPLAGQRRWSEAAAGEVCSGDAESQMRRWSMPWEATKTDRNWQTSSRILPPMSKLSVPQTYSHTGSGGTMQQHPSRSCSQSTTPESAWQSSITSQDGLVEAIQLLSCKPNRYQGQMAAPFIEEPQDLQEAWHQSPPSSGVQPK